MDDESLTVNELRNIFNIPNMDLFDVNEGYNLQTHHLKNSLQLPTSTSVSKWTRKTRLGNRRLLLGMQELQKGKYKRRPKACSLLLPNSGREENDGPY